MMDEKPTKSRKDRERQARADLFLDIARDLIAKDGFSELSMNRIAEIAEYSKGTVYLHFASREMVLMALCLQGLEIWDALTAQAIASDLPALDKLIGCHWAHKIYAQRHPVEYDAIFLVRTSSIREKITPEAHAEFEALLDRIFGRVRYVIEQAEADGDLRLPADLDATALTYGLWALFANDLMGVTRGEQYRPAGFQEGRESDIREALLRTIVDGLHWRTEISGETFHSHSLAVRDRLFANQHGSTAVGSFPGS